MITEHLENGVLKFPEALEGVPVKDRFLVETYMKVMQPVHAFYLEQKRLGFYDGLTKDESLPDGSDSPYTIIRRSEGVYKSFKYTELEPFNRLLKLTASRMGDVVKVAEETEDSERGLIEATLRPLAQAIRDGDFQRATTIILNTRTVPRYHFYVGLLDRYLDPDRGVKFAMQAWLQSGDEKQERNLNDVAQQVLRQKGSRVPLRLLVGDMLAAAGLAADRPWSGNTIPSEDSIRSQVGADSYIFIKNMDEKVEQNLKPAMSKRIPQVKQIPGWEYSIFRAAHLGVTGHEAGHSQIAFDSDAVTLLGGKYMAVKELMSEVFGCPAVAKLPRTMVSLSQSKLIIARSLDQWREYIEEYEDEADPYKKIIVQPYAQAGEWRTNYQERGKGIRVNSDNGGIEILDWDRVVELDEQLSQELRTMVINEWYERGFLERFVSLNSSIPRSYLHQSPKIFMEQELVDDSSLQYSA